MNVQLVGKENTLSQQQIPVMKNVQVGFIQMTEKMHVNLVFKIVSLVQETHQKNARHVFHRFN